VHISASIEIICHVACQEALSADYCEILPEHFWMGMLKFAELPVEDTEKIMPSAATAHQLSIEVDSIRRAFAYRAINTTITRRRLRTELGKGNSPHFEGQLHRTEASRRLFDKAAQFAANAGSQVMMTDHLLSALVTIPTEVALCVLDYELKNWDDTSAATPMINNFGRDITKQVRQRIVEQQEFNLVMCERRAECIAVMRELSSLPNIFLITVSDDAVKQIAADIAHSIIINKAGSESLQQVGGYPTLPSRLQINRIIDLSEASPGELIPRMPTIIDQALLVGKILLVLPACLDEKTPWPKWLFSNNHQKLPPFICRLDPAFYKHHLTMDSNFTKNSGVLWIQTDQFFNIPTEL